MWLVTGIVRDLAAGVAEFCPKALVAIISNPVNSTVPIAAEVFKRYLSVAALLSWQSVKPIRIQISSLPSFYEFLESEA